MKTRQNRPHLYVVGTPIGNLEDLTLRAKTCLQESSIWLVEDTRRAKTLADHIQARPELMRFDDALNEEKRKKLLGKVFGELEVKPNLSVALLSDAGTPGVNDPAAFAVQYCLEAEIAVIPIPGVSALTALWSVTGWQASRCHFLGYFPRKTSDQSRLFVELTDRFAPFELDDIFVVYESPHRILETLQTLSRITEAQGIFSEVVVAKEMTKIFEQFFRGNFSQVAASVEKHLQEQGEKGEWAFAFRLKGSKRQSENHHLLKPILQAILSGGVKPSVAAAWISQLFGEERKSVYQMAIEMKEK